MTLTTKEFIERANLKHYNKYSYSKVVYKNLVTKVIITCLEHGDFEQLPNNHLQKTGCPKCGDKRFTKEQFIEKANLKHGNFYDYSKVVYKNIRSQVIITCPQHGDFEQKPTSHLEKKGCSKCADKTLVIKDFIERAILKHGDLYDYSKVVYKNIDTKVIISCPKHGDFKQAPYIHFIGSGCPKCAYKHSKPSIEWINYLKCTINKEIQNMLSPSGEYKIPKTLYKADGYCKETNTIYEFHGDFWHGNPKVFNKDNLNPIIKKTYGELYELTQNKKKKIMELGYNYIEMWEHDWKKSIKTIIKIQRIWKNYLKNFQKL